MLADNPFALPTPPAPGDRLWCFVDRSLDERSSGRTLRAVVDTFVSRVLEDKAGSRGLLVIGKWGVGKSHTLNEITRLGAGAEARIARINVRDDVMELSKAFSAEKTLFAAIVKLVTDQLSAPASSLKLEQLAKELSSRATFILLDQAEDLVSFEEEEFVRFAKLLAGLLEVCGSRNYPVAIIMALTPERVRLLREKASYVLDRFDKAVFADDMSFNEAASVIENYLGLVRIADIGTRSPTWPFNNESISRILDIWRTEERTIREFRSKCSKVLDTAAKAGVEEIDGLFAANAIHSQYGNWEHCLVEWRNLEKGKHRVLLLALYNALFKVKDMPDIRFDEVIPEQTYHVTSDQKVRTDVLLVPYGHLPVAIEVETGQQIGRHKYDQIAKLVETGEYSGVIVVALSYKGIIRANKVTMQTLKDATRFEVMKVEDTPLKLGRVLSFAALTPDLDFPTSDEVRNGILGSVREDDALTLLKEVLKLTEKVDAIKRRAPVE